MTPPPNALRKDATRHAVQADRQEDADSLRRHTARSDRSAHAQTSTVTRRRSVANATRHVRSGLRTVSACLTLFSTPILTQAQAQLDIARFFDQAIQDQRTGLARKTKPVDARPARPGEIVVTVIAGEGKETESPPAEPGDMVVRNRCSATGNEEFLIKSAKFGERYEGPFGPADGAGWSSYRPRGNEMLYVVVRSSEGIFTFQAPWGESMIARPGDAIVRDPKNQKDTYRVAAAAFDCTYEIIELPRRQ
jgi:hypothetical protein